VGNLTRFPVNDDVTSGFPLARSGQVRPGPETGHMAQIHSRIEVNLRPRGTCNSTQPTKLTRWC